MDSYSPVQVSRPALRAAPRTEKSGLLDDVDDEHDTRARPGGVYLRILRTCVHQVARNPRPFAAAAGMLLLFLLLMSTGRHEHKPPRPSTCHGRGCGGAGGGGRRAAAAQRKPFIYMYDFGTEFTEDVRKVTPAWYSEVYDAEKAIYQMILQSHIVRTYRPEEASLFYVPFYSAYYTSCQYKDWEVNMAEAVARTSKMWSALLGRVRKEHPHFNRTNGADHFSVLSMDHGRCTALTFLNPSEHGEMFFLQPNGDKLVRSVHAHAVRSLQVVGYNYGAPLATTVPDIPCYRSDLDIVLPPTLEASKTPLAITPPSASERTITALFRFAEQHHHNEPVAHHNHRVRPELYELYSKRAVKGWEFGKSDSEDAFRADMRRSVFCICPPGHSQWTSRLTKAVLSGCIPVTFLRDNDNPWQDDIDYRLISVNIDPDALESLEERLEEIMRNPRRLLRMQRAIAAVQEKFLWDEAVDGSVPSLVIDSLRCRSAQLTARS